MDVSQGAVLPHPRPVAGRRSLVIISLVLLMAIAFFVSAALPYLTLDQEVLARYGSRRAWCWCTSPPEPRRS